MLLYLKLINFLEVTTTIHVLMIILCLVLNYYSLNLKMTPIHLDPKKTLISVLYISLKSTTHSTQILGLIFDRTCLFLHLHMESGKNDILKRIACRKPDLAYNTQGWVYPYVVNSAKVFPIYGYTHVYSFCIDVNDIFML